MKKFIAALVLGLSPVLASAAGGAAVPLEPANIDLTDKPSLQRGAKLFVNYCLSCHSAAYQRYNRMGRDIGVEVELVEENLMFASDKAGELMKVALRREDAETWFGKKMPDLSLVARSRGPDWLYTYLTTFYVDPSRPWGVNNQVFKDVGMPHVLWELQGLYAPVYRETTDADGEVVKKVVGYEMVRAGTMTEEEYQAAMRDLTNFLTYMAEPARLDRQRIGVWVLLFLALFTAVAYLLKKEYWKDVH
jgi:ubiquinol-cytochrome c reductase cytochrome c1 subunit